MSQDISELLKKCVKLRETGRLEEAIIQARKATIIDHESANAWWQLALAVDEKNGDGSALTYFERTVEISESFVYGWYRLGNVYKKINQIDRAIEAWEIACDYDEDYEWTRYNLIDAYEIRKIESEKEKLFNHLLKIETQKKLRTNDNHLLAIAYHNKGDYLIAIPYYKKYLAQKEDEYGYTNLSISYSSQQVGQNLDAADCCHMALFFKPCFEKANMLIAKLKPNLEGLNARVLTFATRQYLISRDNWFENYINPFEILQIDKVEESGEIRIKEIQKARKRLLQEIELENGNVEWLPHLKIDKSRAIKIVDELIDEKLRYFHQQIYQNKPLLNFLSRGDLTLFLYNENEVPINILLTFKRDEKFAFWLSEIFSKQYDKLFAQALLNGNIDVIKAILGGRRFVTPEFDDRCFATGLRLSHNFLNDLKAEEKNIEKNKPTIQSVRLILEKNNLEQILKILPSFFVEVKSAAVDIIRRISVRINNQHGDARLAKEVLELACNFRLNSGLATLKIESDIAKLEELIIEEKKNNLFITVGDARFEITRDGVRFGNDFINANEVETLRWGNEYFSNINLNLFSISIGGEGNKTFKVDWSSGSEKQKKELNFKNCLSAIFAFILPVVVDKIKAELVLGMTVYIGRIPINLNGIILESKGWFWNKEEYCPWISLRSEIKNGFAIITSSISPKAEATLSLADTDNAWILHYMIIEGTMK